VDPFEMLPDIKFEKKTEKKVLTLDIVHDILYKKIEEVENTPNRAWGFTRNQITEILKDIIRKTSERGQKDAEADQ
jgi:DNA recombination-dependent growth factor C